MGADGRTIDWGHLSDPGVEWALIPNPEQMFLRTKDNAPAQKQIVEGRPVWVPGREPDEEASTRAMRQFLERSHVKSMAAPGVDRCGEPCLCGGHASKHITGLACDVSGMENLGQQILKRQKEFRTADEAVDHFLAEYQLWRPLAHLPGKAREAWHLEGLPAHHAVQTHSQPAAQTHSQHHHTRSHHSHHRHTKRHPHLHTKLNTARIVHRHGC